MKRFNLNLEKSWNLLQEIMSPERQGEERQRLLELAEAELARWREEVADIKANLDQLVRHPGNESGAGIQRTGLALLATLLVVVDIPLQGLITRAFMPDVPTVLWTVSSVFLAVGIAALVHGAIVAFATDRDRPARSIRVARTIAWVSFLIGASSFAVILMARVSGPSMAARLEDLATLSLFGVAEGAPVAGGALSAWLHFLSAPSLLKRRLAALQSRIRDLEKFIERLKSVGTDDTEPDPVGVLS